MKMNSVSRTNFTLKMTTPNSANEKLKLISEIIQEMLARLDAMDERIDELTTYFVKIGAMTMLMIIVIFQMLQWIERALRQLYRRTEQ